MKKLVLLLSALSLLVVSGYLSYTHFSKQPRHLLALNNEEGEKNEKAQKARFVRERLQYEFDMLKDPITGKIPDGIFERERAFARTLPVKGNATIMDNGTMRTLVANNYIPAGPNNIGGRTRAVEYDRRFNGTSNQIILAGCVSGGIMRSTDGGNSWVRVSPQEDIHNVNTLAQDPNNPDVWYAGGGEALGNTAGQLGAFYLGFGLYKSTNNGASWTRLPLNTITNIDGTGNLGTGTLEAFDHPFDLAHRVVVNPTNSHIYIAGHRRLVRSTDGGTTFRVVFESNTSATSATGQLDVEIAANGRVYLAANGAAAAERRGVWFSNSGDPGSFIRIAGGSVLGVDSVDGWRGNSFNGLAKRILVRLAPSNNNIGYVYYENGLSGDGIVPKPEADFFRFDVSGTNFTWTNRSANMPDFPGGNLSGSDPLALQGGYNMELAIKPDDPNVVFIGGTNLYRSADGFASTASTAWIGGYTTNFLGPSGYSQYPQSHADIHRLVFSPANSNRAICANDGSVQETTGIMEPTVQWRMLPNYQTLQCYNVALDPGAGRNNIASGSQDNGVRLRDVSGVLGTPPADSNRHQLLFSADGAYVGLSLDNNGTQYIYESIQFGRLLRARLTNPFQGSVNITPANLTTSSPSGGTNEFGEFVTNFRLVTEATEVLYYVNFNRLFRTTSASTVTSNGWTELTSVSSAVNPTNPTGGRNIAIRGLGFSRGPYSISQALYIGTTNGKIFRLDNPRDADPFTPPVDITPSGLTGNVQDIAVNPNDDNEVMAVVTNYGAVGVWWTKNAKSTSPTWRNAEGNLTLPSFRSCAIVVKKDAAGQPVTEYYVGTSVGLYSVTNLGTVLDAGQSPVWQREGGDVLNFSVITSLAYRPADNVMAVGTHGNGIYYTYLGTPNFAGGVSTSIIPITNDRSFIRLVAPTFSSSAINYQIGNLTGISKISVRILNMNGQVVRREERGYQSGSIPVQQLASGVYLLYIQSNDNRYRHVQKIVRE